MRTRAMTLVAAVLTASCARAPLDRAQRFIARGDQFVAAGRDAAAVLEYRNAVREMPASAEIHRKLGDAFERLGRTGEAYRSYARAFEFVDGQALPSDEEGLRAIVARHPAAVAPRIALARARLRRHDAAGAEAQLLAVTAVEPGHELANRALAALNLEAGRIADAEAHLTIAASQPRQRYRSRIALADFLIAQGRYADARPWLDRARREPALERAAALRLAAIDYEAGRVRAAERAVSTMIEAHPTARAWTLQGRFQLRDGDADAALRSARAALALDPRLPAARALMDDLRIGGSR